MQRMPEPMTYCSHPTALPANPFATRFVRPGAIGYLFPAGASLAGLLEQLERQGWRGQIVGPHGTGKSALLETVIPHLQDAGRDVHYFTLRGGQAIAPPPPNVSPRWSAVTQVVVDGFERLSWWRRAWCRALCRRSGAGLLVTAHSPVGLPALPFAVPTVELARRIVASRCPLDKGIVTVHDVDASFMRHGGNMREVLFEMYDRHEARSRAKPRPFTPPIR